MNHISANLGPDWTEQHQEQTMNVYKKLNEARAKFHALKLEKTGRNNFAGYNYFELGDFLIPALRVFNEVGLCAVVSFDKEMATMRIQDTQSSEHIILTSPLSEASLKGCHPVQNVGACETYARRYLWVAALEIVEHDALDATTGKPTTSKGISSDVSVSPTKEAFMALQPEVQDLLRKAAPKIAAAMPDMPVVMERYQWVIDNYDQELRQDIEAGLFYLLDPKTRAAIKAAQKETA
jgi:hypothetical protein